MKVKIIAALLENSFQAMLKVFLICCVGYTAANYPKAKPLLSKEALQYISKLSTCIFIPCLTMSSLGSSLSADMFSQVGFLVICCPLITIVSYCFSETVGKVLMDRTADESVLTAFSVASCFANTISLPIMIMQTLCEEPIVNADYDNDSIKCNDAVSGMIFLYGVGFHSMYWTYAVGRLRSVSGGNSTTQSGGCSCSWECLKGIFLTPAIIGVVAGLVIGLCEPLRSHLFGDEASIFRAVGSSIKTLGQPVVAVQSLVMSASLGQVALCGGRHRSEAVERIESSNARKRVVLQMMTIVSPSLSRSTRGGGETYSPLSSTEIDSSAHQSLVTSNRSQHSPSADRSLHNSMHNSMHSGSSHNNKSNHAMDEDGDVEDLSGTSSHGPMEAADSTASQLPSARNIIAVIFCKLIFTPAVVIPLTLVCAQYSIIPKQARLLQLLLCVQSGTSSAQVIVVSLNDMGNSTLASKVAYSYFYQYLCSFFTITVWSTVAMSYIYSF